MQEGSRFLGEVVRGGSRSAWGNSISVVSLVSKAALEGGSQHIFQKMARRVVDF